MSGLTMIRAGGAVFALLAIWGAVGAFSLLFALTRPLWRAIAERLS